MLGAGRDYVPPPDVASVHRSRKLGIFGRPELRKIWIQHAGRKQPPGGPFAYLSTIVLDLFD
jgi:hypothetical protein